MILILLGSGFIAMISRILFAGSLTFIKTKTKQAEAVIINKRKREMYRSSGIYTNYFVLFRLGENDTMELPVNKKLFKADNLGKSGILTYKGEIFISFTPDEDIQKKPKKETYILNGQVVEK